jgi:DNA repair exonuclease SbcCD ATPase subunit
MANNKSWVNIPPAAKIKIAWEDRPENYTKENKIKVRNYFANKYGVNKANISIQFKAIRINANGDTVEIMGAGIENIMDATYQRGLMKEVIARDGKVVNFDRIVALDDKVNSELDVDLTVSQHKNWSIKWIMLDNFLSFGENNFVPFTRFKGFTIVNSIPANQGGKTTLTIDAIKFLLHGTTTKTDKNEEIFNTYSGRNELTVRGMINIEGDEVIIERKMKISDSKAVTNKVSYYEILPDGTEKILSGEHAKETTKKIKETIGSEKDFERLVLANESNLDDLIGLTSTESGKVITRLIGLEVLEMKEAIVRKMYNTFAGKKKSNEFDVITLTTEIEEHDEKLVQSKELIELLNEKLSNNKKEIETLNNKKDDLLNSKDNIDVTIFELNPSKLESDIETLINKGVHLKEKSESLIKLIEENKNIIFNEDLHFQLTKELNKNNTDKAVNEAEMLRLKKVIKQLVDGGICQSCNRKLDDVDNSEHILKHEQEMDKVSEEILRIVKSSEKIEKELGEISVNKLIVDTRNRHELDKDRAEVEMGALRNSINNKKNDLKKYKLNLNAIEMNKKIDTEVDKVKTDLVVLEYSKTEILTKLERISFDVTNHREKIVEKTKLIETIKKEEEVDKIYKIYIDLVGKKGISKLVLRSVLPIINSEVQRLLEDVVDFDVEIYIDDKNDVQFLLNKDGVSKRLKSGSGLEKTAASIALRCVLGKMSTLPMPNFITFDEVLGRVGAENMDKINILFNKVKDMYEIVFLITHNDLVKDWGDNILTVTKPHNISQFTIK